MRASLPPLVELARSELRQVRDWLLRPTAETMSACVPALERAILCLTEVSRLAPPVSRSSPLISATAALAQELRQVRALFLAAGQLYFGAMRRFSTPAALDNPPDEPGQPISTLG